MSTTVPDDEVKPLETPLWTETVPAGAHFSVVARRGTALTLTAGGADANVSMLLYNYEQPSERLNVPDTLKGQHTARITRGHVLYSDMGRAMCSVIEDTLGWHDPLCGVSDRALVAGRYGEARYQACRNDFYRNGRDSLLTELHRYGLGRPDLVAPVNFFSKVTAADDGGLSFQCDHSHAGDRVTLRFELDCLVLLSTCQHPLDPAPAYQPRALTIDCVACPPAAADDPCRLHCPENARAFENTERLFPRCDGGAAV